MGASRSLFFSLLGPTRCRPHARTRFRGNPILYEPRIRPSPKNGSLHLASAVVRGSSLLIDCLSGKDITLSTGHSVADAAAGKFRMIVHRG